MSNFIEPKVIDIIELINKVIIIINNFTYSKINIMNKIIFYQDYKLKGDQGFIYKFYSEEFRNTLKRIIKKWLAYGELRKILSEFWSISMTNIYPFLRKFVSPDDELFVIDTLFIVWKWKELEIYYPYMDKNGDFLFKVLKKEDIVLICRYNDWANFALLEELNKMWYRFIYKKSPIRWVLSVKLEGFVFRQFYPIVLDWIYVWTLNSLLNSDVFYNFVVIEEFLKNINIFNEYVIKIGGISLWKGVNFMKSDQVDEIISLLKCYTEKWSNFVITKREDFSDYEMRIYFNIIAWKIKFYWFMLKERVPGRKVHNSRWVKNYIVFKTFQELFDFVRNNWKIMIKEGDFQLITKFLEYFWKNGYITWGALDVWILKNWWLKMLENNMTFMPPCISQKDYYFIDEYFDDFI